MVRVSVDQRLNAALDLDGGGGRIDPAHTGKAQDADGVEAQYYRGGEAEQPDGRAPPASGT